MINTIRVKRPLALVSMYLDSVVRIVKRGLGSNSLLEVGCGKAYFLELLESKGVQITGFDPTYEGKSNLLKEIILKKVFL
jgi:hypothetical protein